MSRRIIISSQAKSVIRMPTSLSTPRLFAWFSRTSWCAPVLSHYSSIGVEGRWVSMPMVLPIDSDTLLNCNHSVEEAYEKLCDYEQKMLHKVSRTAKTLVQSCLTSLRWSSEPFVPQLNVPATITGCVDDILRGCPLQASFDGIDAYDAYTEAETETSLDVHVDGDKVTLTYGNLAQFVVWKDPESVQSVLENGFAHHQVVVYFDPDHNVERFSMENCVFIPVKRLGVAFDGKAVEAAGCVVQVISTNLSVCCTTKHVGF